MARKTFAITNAITTSIGETLEQAEEELLLPRQRLIPISLIEFDPNNPRDLAINREDLPGGPQENDPLYEQKKKELDEILSPMASSIKKVGVIMPIEVYEKEETYGLIHGECRCLASILAGKTTIPAFMLSKQRNDYEKTFVQLVENFHRNDLSLYQKIKNIVAVHEKYQKHFSTSIPLDTKFVKDLIGCSERQARNYASIINGAPAILKLIKEDKIKNIESAAIIASIKNQSLQKEILIKAEEGVSTKGLRRLIKVHEVTTKTKETNKKCGVKPSRVNMGFTKSFKVIQTICDSILANPKYGVFKKEFNNTNWNNFRDCSSAFKKIVKIIEELEGSK